MPRVTAKKANKAYPQHGIKKGDTYYTWKFYRGRKHMSLTRPKPSQLTQRADYGALRRAQEELGNWEVERRSELIDEIGAAIGCLEEARDASQGRYDNMPEQWQGAEMGQNAETFCSECDDAISELETIRDQLDDTSAMNFDEIDNPHEISWPQEY
jgi:hypothetical protein